MTRDSLVGIAFVLELLARENKTVSEIVDSLPKYIMQKDKITFEGDFSLLSERLKTKFSDTISVNTLDGIRFDWADYSWVHVRNSNTEPKMWIIREALDEARANQLFEQVKSIL
jgi:phosphomannomutase